MTDTFAADLSLSKQAHYQDSDIATLRAMFPEAVSVTKTDDAQDRAGTDYLIGLRGGAVIKVDAKTRRPGCRQHWKAGPEVALENWSVMPGGKFQTPDARARTGWALDESKEIDLILYTFHPDDHKFAYVRSFPLIRQAFRDNYSDWIKPYRRRPEETRRGNYSYESQSFFVPLIVLDQALEAMSRRQRAGFQETETLFLCHGSASMTASTATPRRFQRR